VAHDQESVTVWDDAVRHAAAKDRDWLNTNLGGWMHTYFGHDIAVVLDADRSELYRYVVDSAGMGDDLTKAYLPLVERLQSRLESGDTDGTGDRILSIGEADLLDVGNRPAIVSVKPIVSDTGNIEQELGSENLHVAVRFLDGDLPDEIAREYQFDDLRFSLAKSRDPNRLSVPITSRDGSTVGYFDWEPFRPGSKVLQATVPALVLALVAIFATASFSGGVIWRRTMRLAASQGELRHQADHDALTGLSNRAHFERELAGRLEATGDGDRRCVLFIDLDRFKAVNDTFGHPAGDKLITMVAERLRSLLPEALIARLGGDEFTVLLEGDDADHPDVISGAIIKTLNETFDLGGLHASIGASVGAATALGRANALEMTRQADIALYHSKSAGRNTYAIFGSHMDELLQKRRRLEADLREAVQNRIQIATFFQPVFSSANGQVSSLEALVRWKHPVLGYVKPDTFIPIAEEMGLIHEIGQMVLGDACKLMAELPDLVVAVNASVLEISSPGYSLRVLSMLASSNIDPKRLEVEVTESFANTEAGRFEQNIASLRAAGVTFAIDDFGTGYSSFSRVQMIEADRIKIDRSFVSALDSSDNKALVAAMVSMAQAKGLKITAEGVETAQQRDVLEKLGCDNLQGFLLSRPLPYEDIRALLFPQAMAM
jgi:diguanylate cyclase (GGDEF)-like protein